MYPINTTYYLTFPTTTVTNFINRSFIQSNRRYWASLRIFYNCSSSSWHISMHEEIILIHILLHQHLILLSISTRYYKVVLTANKPVKLFKPKHLPYSIYLLGSSVFVYLLNSIYFCLSYSYFGCTLCLLLFLITLLLNFKVLPNVHLSRNMKVNIYSHHRIKVSKLFINLVLSLVIIFFIHSI